MEPVSPFRSLRQRRCLPHPHAGTAVLASCLKCTVFRVRREASALHLPAFQTLQSGFPGRSDLGPSGAGSRCEFGPHLRTAAAILLFGILGCCRRAFHPGPPSFCGSNNGRPSSRTQSPLALLGRLGIRLPFNLGPAGFLSRRHFCPDDSRTGDASLGYPRGKGMELHRRHQRSIRSRLGASRFVL